MSKVIGIDLGTTFSAIASLDDLGNPEVLASIDDNRKITASAVYVKNQEVIVGDKALNYLRSESNNVILQTKREMENDVVYSTNEGKWVKNTDLIDGYTPAQISSLILKKLKDYTTDVKKAVITVPAMFAERARQATLDAAKIADIEVIELINEPTAAVLHYASLPGVEVGGRVMIFDLGGGTFDVTFAEVRNKKVDVLTSRGDKYLGGRDFDKEITKIIRKKYREAHNSEIDIENNKEYIHKAEEVKKILSVRDKASIDIDGPNGIQKIEITKDEFEESIQTYIEKIKMLIEEAMEASGMNPSRINQTLLVGGSTRLPIITKVLTNLMGKPPVKGVNVDEAVVCGAAIYAGLKSEQENLSDQQQEALKDVKLTDVCNFYMGTLAVIPDPLTNRQVVANTIIIERDQKLPVSVTKRYTTMHENQQEIECSVTQSEGPEDNKEFVNIIHNEMLKLPKGRPAGQPIDITYSYDESGKMHCMFTDVESGNTHEIELTPETTESIDNAKKQIEEISIE
jgi:molecular chaperone DnaK